MSQITPNYDNNYILSQIQVPQSLLVNQHPAQTQEVTLPDLYYMPDNFEKKKGFKDVIKKFKESKIIKVKITDVQGDYCIGELM